MLATWQLSAQSLPSVGLGVLQSDASTQGKSFVNLTSL